MRTELTDSIRDTPDGRTADSILRSCVHCGFCNATCPTYQLLGDELDGPRGRIYLIKQVLEGATPSASTQLHLDRCLTCRACETTCPSGVQYGRLLDIGRRVVDEQVPRRAAQRLARATLKSGLTSAWFSAALRLGQWLRPVLPRALRAKVPARQSAGAWPDRAHSRRVVLLAGCVQPALRPNIAAATARVLDALGISVTMPRSAGCCGAIHHHLDDHAGGLDAARRNIDAWSAELDAGAEAIVMNASGCGAMVREYGHLLRGDVLYAEKALRVSKATRDIAELLDGMGPALRLRLGAATRHDARVVFHPPCTLQHAQQVRGTVERLLAALGAEVAPVDGAHSCCGSAGTYSILQPRLAGELRAGRLAALQASRPQVILSANIGCITHLQAGTSTRVQHWIEWVDEQLARVTGPL